MVDMETPWQFPCCRATFLFSVPQGDQKPAKSIVTLKKFYSIVVMAIVNAKDRFNWASVGFPGNSHDSVILQSTELWHEITENNVILKFTHKKNFPCF